MKNTGWAALPGLFEKPPVSTQQILHPALYRSGKTPTNVALPPLEKLLGGNWSKLDENIMGEFGWKEVLKQFLDDDRAKTLAAAWDGDRYIVFEQKQTKKLILVTRLRSEEHTSELQSQSNLVCRLLLEKKKNKYYLSIQSIHKLPPALGLNYAMRTLGFRYLNDSHKSSLPQSVILILS